MEEILDLYVAPHSAAEPLICMDEAAKHLRSGALVGCVPGHPAKEDYHYERHGVQALFMFFDPLRGWRRVSGCDSRTQVDWALQVRQLLEVDYPHAHKVKLVCDNLNTHSKASLYKAFPAEVAGRLARRLELHYTPRQGSWLNMAELELSVLARQCLQRRIASAEELAGQIDAWQRSRNAAQSTIAWRFTTADARTKLRHLYPQQTIVE
jgi:AraC-like DNA-binding protein